MTTKLTGARGELLALVSFLPRCQRPAWAAPGRLPPIATHEVKTGGRFEKLCGVCSRARRDSVELPYRALLRWILRCVASGQVIPGGVAKGGMRTLTLVAPPPDAEVLETRNGT